MDILEYITEKNNPPFLVQVSSRGVNITRPTGGEGLSLFSDSRLLSDAEMETIRDLGFACIDWRTVPESNETMAVSVPVPSEDARNLPFSPNRPAPREVVATIAQLIGATVHNIETVKLHPKMFCRVAPETLELYCGYSGVAAEAGQRPLPLVLKGNKVQSLLRVCEILIANNDDCREAMESTIKDLTKRKDYDTENYLEAVDDLNRFEFLDTLLSHYWGFIVYHGLQVNVGNLSDENAQFRIKHDILNHLAEHMKRFSSLDENAYYVQKKTLEDLTKMVDALVLDSGI
jgi:hypothetical protein